MNDSLDTPTAEAQTATSPVAAPTLPYTMHATLKEYFKRLGYWRFGIAFLLTLIIAFRFGFVAWLIFAVIIAALLVGIFWYMKNRRLELDANALTFVNAFGKKTTISYTDIEGVKVFINYYEPSFGVSPRVSIASQSGTAPITVTGLYWTLEDLDALIAVLNDKKAKVEYFEDIATYSMIAKQFPTYATYVERHPIKLAMIIVAVLTVGIFAVAALMTFVW